MATERLLASVQYNDWKGTSAADMADKNSPESWLTVNGHKKPDEFLLGITIFAGENHGSHEDPVLVEFLLTTPGDRDGVKAKVDSSQGPIEVRKVSVKMKLNEFFGLFKRFSITLSSYGMLDERDYACTD